MVCINILLFIPPIMPERCFSRLLIMKILLLVLNHLLDCLPFNNRMVLHDLFTQQPTRISLPQIPTQSQTLPPKVKYKFRTEKARISWKKKKKNEFPYFQKLEPHAPTPSVEHETYPTTKIIPKRFPCFPPNAITILHQIFHTKSNMNV